jgi:hypothetical protein
MTLRRATLGLAIVVLALRSAALQAQHEGAIAGGMAASAAAATASREARHDERIPGVELSDWSDSRSGSTTRMATGCGGVALEATLSSTPGRNFVTVTLANDAPVAVAFLPGASRFRFGGGAYRRFADVSADLQLDAGWLVTRRFAFPDKESFEVAQTLELEVRVLPEGAQAACPLRVVFERNKEQPANVRSHVSYTTLELELGVGARVLETGGLGELGNGASLHLDFAGFFGVHHGMTISLVADLHGSGAVDDISPETRLDAHPSISGTGFLVGYIGRVYITPWLSAAYNAATGPYVFELTSENEDGPELATAVLPLRHRLRLSADFLRLPDGSRFSLAASLTQLLVPYGDFGRVELRGSSIAASLELMIGG